MLLLNQPSNVDIWRGGVRGQDIDKFNLFHNHWIQEGVRDLSLQSKGQGILTLNSSNLQLLISSSCIWEKSLFHQLFNQGRALLNRFLYRLHSIPSSIIPKPRERHRAGGQLLMKGSFYLGKC